MKSPYLYTLTIRKYDSGAGGNIPLDLINIIVETKAPFYSSSQINNAEQVFDVELVTYPASGIKEPAFIKGKVLWCPFESIEDVNQALLIAIEYKAAALLVKVQPSIVAPEIPVFVVIDYTDDSIEKMESWKFARAWIKLHEDSPLPPLPQEAVTKENDDDNNKMDSVKHAATVAAGGAAGAAVAGVGTTAVVTGMGFTSSGILAGSTAAAMMSAEAIAAGGGVAAGGTVATLQSIGAGGLLAAGPIGWAVLGAGALVGGLGVAAIHHHISNKNKNKNQNQNKDQGKYQRVAQDDE